MRSLGSWWQVGAVASLILVSTSTATPPKIVLLSQPSDQIVGLGMHVRFATSPFGPFSQYQFQWSHNDNPIPDATNGYLHISPATYLDAGEYAAVVRNASSSVTSRVATLTVVPAARVERVGGLPSIGFVYCFALEESLAYVGVSTSSERGRLAIYDVADPSDPQFVGGFLLPYGYSTITDVTLSNSMAFVVGGYPSAGRVDVLDVSNPSHPSSLGTYKTSNSAMDLSVRDHIAYVGTSRGLELVHVRDPASMFRLGLFPSKYPVYNVELDGSIAYVAATNNGLLILDVSDPTSPTLLANLKSSLGIVDSVQAVGHLLYVSGSNGPQVVDVTHPRFPRIVGKLGISLGSSYGMGRLGSLLIEGGIHQHALSILDASDPSRLILIGQAPTAGSIEAVETVGNRIYLAVASGGFEIFDFHPPTDPPVVLVPPQPLTSVAGTTAELRVEASGGGPLHFQWAKNGTPLPGETNQNLRLPAVSSSDVAEYSVTVGNAAGQVPGGSASLNLTPPPALRLDHVDTRYSTGPLPSVSTTTGIQGELLGTRDFHDWQPIWYGRFGDQPLVIIDAHGTNAPMRSYRLKLGAR